MNIVLIVIDTQRADHLGCYGYFRNTSPNMDRLASEGLLFEDFYATSVATGPAFTSIFTGLYAINHEYYVFLRPNLKLLDDLVPTLPEVLVDNGYTTAAFDNLINFPEHPKHFVRGFEFYTNVTRSSLMIPHHVLADQIHIRLIPWIRDHSKEEFFLFLHYWEPHGPFKPSDPCRDCFSHKRESLSDLEVKEAPAGYEYVPGWGKVGEIFEGDQPGIQSKEVEGEYYSFPGYMRSIDLYDGKIVCVDRAIGQIRGVLEEEKILDDTLIIITADHGEQMGQHYHIYGHGGLHDSNTHLPLIMRHPTKLPSNLRVKGFAQQMDIAPTIFDFAEIYDVPKIDGKSLRPLIEGKKIREKIFMEGGAQRAVRTSEWKLIETVLDQPRLGCKEGMLELYNVNNDPVEVINLIEKENYMGRRLREDMRRWVTSNLRGRPDPLITAFGVPSSKIT